MQTRPGLNSLISKTTCVQTSPRQTRSRPNVLTSKLVLVYSRRRGNLPTSKLAQVQISQDQTRQRPNFATTTLIYPSSATLSRSLHLSVTFTIVFLRPNLLCIFFRAGTVTNPAIGSVLSAVRISLSLTTVTVRLA